MKRFAENLRKALIGVFVVALLPTLSTVAFGGDRVIVYPLQAPSSVQQQLIQRYPRLAIGAFLRDMLGPSNLAGTYANMQINPVASSMNVTVSPSTVGTDGTLYQLGADDNNPIPQQVQAGQPQLAADPTTIMIQGLLSTTTGNLGPMTAPGTSGQSVYYLVEAQIQQQDTLPASELFVDQSAQKYYQTVNTDRTDAIVFQLKAGAAAVSPTVPSTDTGWISIGTVLIPYGTSAITSGMITMTSPFGGFTTATDIVHLFPNPQASPPDVGSTYVSGGQQSGSLGVGTPAPSPSGQAQIAMSLGVAAPAPTATGQVVVNRSLGVGTPAPAPTGMISANGAIAAGASTGASLTAGDLGASRSASTGALTIGGSTTAATCDFGVTTAGVVTCNQPFMATPACPPVPQVYTSGSGSYTTPFCHGVLASYLTIKMAGGGGGGSGSVSTNGQTAGGNTTFGASFLTANGGTAGGVAAAGSGGAASGGNLVNEYGGNGCSVLPNLSGQFNAPGSCGGNNPLGSQTTGSGTGSGFNAVSCGSGGSGAGSSGVSNSEGGGGGAGGYVEALVNGPAASYAYSIGSGGTGGTGSGTGSSNGGSGANGCMYIIAHWFGL